MKNIMIDFIKSIFAPYAEVDGISFFRKASFDRYISEKKRSKAREEGKLHTLRYCGYGSEVIPMLDSLREFLDDNRGEIVEIVRFCDNPFDGRLVVDYICDKKYWRNCSRD